MPSRSHLNIRSHLKTLDHDDTSVPLTDGSVAAWLADRGMVALVPVEASAAVGGERKHRLFRTHRWHVLQIRCRIQSPPSH